MYLYGRINIPRKTVNFERRIDFRPNYYTSSFWDWNCRPKYELVGQQFGLKSIPSAESVEMLQMNRFPKKKSSIQIHSFLLLERPAWVGSIWRCPNRAVTLLQFLLAKSPRSDPQQVRTKFLRKRIPLPPYGVYFIFPSVLNNKRYQYPVRISIKPNPKNLGIR